MSGSGQGVSNGLNNEEETMNFNDIRQKAKDMEIKTHRKNKSDLIRAIQRAENNIDCYGTTRVDVCDENACLWRSDCLSQSGSAVQN